MKLSELKQHLSQIPDDYDIVIDDSEGINFTQRLPMVEWIYHVDYGDRKRWRAYVDKHDQDKIIERRAVVMI